MMVKAVGVSVESEQDCSVSSTNTMEGRMEGFGSPCRDISEGVSEEMGIVGVIDLLEEKVSEVESSGEAEKDGEAKDLQPHSVEYWSVAGAKDKPKTLIKQYPCRQSRPRKSGFNNKRNWYGLAGTSGCQDGMLGRRPGQIMANLGSSMIPMQPLQQQVLNQPPALTGSPTQQQIATPSLQLFAPPLPDHAWTSQTSGILQLFPSPVPQINHIPSPSPFIPVTHHHVGPYLPPYYGSTLHQPPYPSNAAPPMSQQVSYYQGAPLFYQAPQVPFSTLNPLAPQFYCDPSIYDRHHNYPPPPYEYAIQTGTGILEPRQVGIGALIDLCKNTFSNPASTSPIASSSSSDVDVSAISGNVGSEYLSPRMTEYDCSSSSSSPLLTSSNASESSEENPANKNLAKPSISVMNQDVSIPNTCSMSEIIAMGLQSWNCNSQLMPVRSQMSQTHAVQYQSNLLVYPGTDSILMYTLSDGNRNAILYNEEEVPYVSNVFDLRVEATFKEQIGPALHYPYYVPPRTSDKDFFGGQMPIWQVKMGQYFLKFQPHNWKMHGVPEVFNLEMFLGSLMDVVDEFHIVSKLRFSCRTCKTPWTSKKGTIVFKFCFHSGLSQGWILMRIYGQTCMREECNDWSFQSPACYPEEIDRAMKKLSEYIGNKCYGIAVPPSCFDDCFKSIRRSVNVGNNSSANKELEKSHTPSHRREFCQACLNGVCKNIFTKPFALPAPDSLTSPTA